MSETIDIVSLVNNNTLTELSENYGSRVVELIQQNFPSDKQRLFVANFYCYLKCDPKDFVIALDSIWKWLGYGRINDCKRVLVKHFKEKIDYIINQTDNYEVNVQQDDEVYFTEVSVNKNNGETRGRKNENIMLTINCFKKLCLKSRTDRADEIHEYYIRLEELMNMIMVEQTKDLREKIKDVTNQKDQNLISNFGKRQILYLAYAEDNVAKPGITNDFERRLGEFRNEIRPDFSFEYVYESMYNREIERRLHLHPEMIKRRFEKTYIKN